jgi:3-dehydroquinate dehydratase II
MSRKAVRVLVVHGPNLNLLGEREPEIYGSETLPELNQRIRAHAKAHSMSVRFFQSNGEGEIIDALHQHRKWADAVIINPGAYTHYSYAIRDAVSSINLPCVEVHLSDLKKREKFRRLSVISPVCLKQISGWGGGSYLRALDLLRKSIP